MINQELNLISETIKEAWISIKSYKLRSFLTILGVVIGIASVVVMISIGEAVQRQIDEQFSSLGSNLLTVRPGSPNIRGFSSGNVQTLTFEDADAIRNLNFIDNVGYSKNSSGQAIYNKNNKTVTIYGISFEYVAVMNMKTAQGRSFTDREIKAGTAFALIGKNVADELYKDENPIGKVIRVKNIPFKIIGVLEEKGSGFGPSQDDAVFIPFKTFLQKVSGSRFPKAVSQIVINVKDEMYLTYAQEKISELLRQRHKLRGNQEDDFRIMNLKDLADSFKSTTETFSLLLASIASISLIVGSIGIMNMMLVSVSERTKEIGLRKAIGAKENTIMQQFLFEALLISFLGSMSGLIMGFVFSQVAAFFLKMELHLSFYAVILSIIVSIVVGIASGFMPALKAARMNPIDALRYE